MAYSRFNSISRITTEEKLKGINIHAPATGKVSIINDPMYLALGEGVLIELNKGEVVCPFAGKILDVLPSHAKVVVQATNKMKFLIQLPPSYTEQMGLGIAPKVSIGDQVRAGEPLFNIDLYKVQQHLKPVSLAFIILDSAVLGRVQVPHSYVEMSKDILVSLVPLKKKK